MLKLMLSYVLSYMLIHVLYYILYYVLYYTVLLYLNMSISSLILCLIPDSYIDTSNLLIYKDNPFRSLFIE
jgi:hypothetical protein